MKQNKTILIMAVIFSLLSTAFAMSGDGGQQPVKTEKGNEAVQEQQAGNVVQVVEEESGQEEKTGVRVTVKDRLGIDTGMTKAELDEFKAQYIKRAEELGIENYPSVSPYSYFEHKINLNAIEELKNLGLFIKKNPFLTDENFAYNVTHSDMIILGEIDSVEYLYDSKEDEWKADMYILSKCYVKIEKILKNNEFHKIYSDKVTYLSTNGKFLTSGEYKMNFGQKYIFFLKKRSDDIDKFKNDFSKLKGSIRIENENTYLEYFDDEYKNCKEIFNTINTFNAINDGINFYKREYSVTENKNEK